MDETSQPPAPDPEIGRRRPRQRLFGFLPMWSWLIVVGIAGGIAGIGAYTFLYAEGASYLSDDPQACVNCHVMRDVYAAWGKSSHKAVAACNDCHTPHTSIIAKYAVKAINGVNHSLAFTTGAYPQAIRITPLNRDVAQGNCLNCHAELVSLISHANSSNPTDCLRCHSRVGHDY